MSMLSEQIKELRELSNLNFLDVVFKDALKDAADTIEELSAKLHKENMERSTAYYNGGWIPCSERLPEIPKENPLFENKLLELYLVAIAHADYPFRAFWNGKIFTDGFSKVEPVAWMPLPQPYKEGKYDN